MILNNKKKKFSSKNEQKNILNEIICLPLEGGKWLQSKIENKNLHNV